MAATMAEERPQKRTGIKIPADFVRAVLKGHSQLGLAFAAVLYLVCLTGTIAVFAHELGRWENATVHAIPSVTPEAVQRALAAAVKRAGTAPERVYITLPGDDLPWLQIGAEIAGTDRSWAADAEGRLTESAAGPWTEFLTRLHINLHLPRTWGLFVVGLSGVALLSSLISGLLAHPRIFRDAFHLRVGGSPRLQEADLHNRLGVWALPFHLTVSLTGALLGLTTLIVGVLGMAVFQGDSQRVYELFLPPHPPGDARPAPLMDLRPMFAQIQRLSPGGKVEYLLLEHPTEMGGAALFNVKEDPRRLAGTAMFGFNRDGKAYHVTHAAENNLGQAIIGSLGVLHFGWFGGGTIKIAYGLLGLALTYLSAGGVWIWLERRRAKGRPAPGWERIWAAVVWGQPLALAASALAVILIGRAGAQEVTTGLPLTVWGGVSAAALLASAWAPASTLARFARLGTAALLLLVALSHLALIGAHTADPMGWTVNGVFTAIAAVLGMIGWRRTSAARS